MSALFLECLEFVREQSAGEWGDKLEREDAAKLEAFCSRLLEAARADERAKAGGAGEREADIEHQFVLGKIWRKATSQRDPLVRLVDVQEYVASKLKGRLDRIAARPALNVEGEDADQT